MNPICKLPHLVGLASVLLLAGCGSTQPTRFFSLHPQASPQSLPALSRTSSVQITGFYIPAIFDRDEIMREVSPGELDADEFEHWAAPFSQMARQILSEDLAARMPPGVVIFPGSPTPVDAIQLTVNLVSYRVIGHSAQLQASWSLKLPRPSGETTVSEGTPWRPELLLLQSPIGDGKGAATANAVNDLLAQLSDQIVLSLSKI